MADPITDGFSALAELLDEIEEIGIIAQIGVSLGLTLFALVFSRYIILKAAWRVVRRTEVEWDNEILDPLFNRVYIFVLTAGWLTMMWTLGRNDALHRCIALLLRNLHTP